MKGFDQAFLGNMKDKLDVELIGVVPVKHSPELKKRAASLLPGARSAVVVGKEIFREVVALAGPTKETGAAAPGDLLGPHGEYLNARLTKAVYDLAGIFRKEGYPSLPLAAGGCPTDERFAAAMLSYKHVAELAGLGTFGRHSLLVTPAYGPRVRLACLLTEAPLEASPNSAKNSCIRCDACLKACPAQALQKPGKGQKYSMNVFACRSYRRAGLSCSMCMKVCDQALS